MMVFNYERLSNSNYFDLLNFIYLQILTFFEFSKFVELHNCSSIVKRQPKAQVSMNWYDCT